VHHIFPVHYCRALGRPDLELDERNLVTLCESEPGRPGFNHHLLVGHLGDFEAANPSSRADATGRFLARTAAQLRIDRTWLEAVAGRLPMLASMPDTARTAFASTMNQAIPDRPQGQVAR
jgi:hypothetical protein